MGRIDGAAAPTDQSPNPGQAGQPVNYGSYPGNVQTGQALNIGRPWDSGLFDCHNDPTNAVMTAFFPCVTFGQIAEVMDGIQPSQGAQLSCTFGALIYAMSMAVCAECYIGSKYRAKLRQKYNLVEAPYEDVIAHIFCPFCSLCQEFRELKSRELDPALGWKGILAKQQEMMKNPPPPQPMSK